MFALGKTSKCPSGCSLSQLRLSFCYVCKPTSTNNNRHHNPRHRNQDCNKQGQQTKNCSPLWAASVHPKNQKTVDIRFSETKVRNFRQEGCLLEGRATNSLGLGSKHVRLQTMCCWYASFPQFAMTKPRLRFLKQNGSRETIPVICARAVVFCLRSARTKRSFMFFLRASGHVNGRGFHVSALLVATMFLFSR